MDYRTYHSPRGRVGSGYRYRLGRLTTVCPQCRRRTFKPYLDTETSTPLAADECGRCNREFKCGYHVSPSEWFAAHGGLGGRILGFKSIEFGSIEFRGAEPDFIPRRLMEATLCHYELNPLYAFLCRHFGSGPVDEVMALYCVGTAARWGGSTVYWQIDPEGRVRTGKVMGYDPLTGRRLKNPPRVGWVHRLAPDIAPSFRLEQTWFGARLLGERPGRLTVMVESEKTALITALCAREAGLEWNVVATGGCGGLNLDPERRADPCYRGNALPQTSGLLLIPDADAAEKWRKCRLEPYVRRWQLVEPSALGLSGSQDIGDLLLTLPESSRRDLLQRLNGGGYLSP